MAHDRCFCLQQKPIDTKRCATHYQMCTRKYKVKNAATEFFYKSASVNTSRLIVFKVFIQTELESSKVLIKVELSGKKWKP